MLVGYMRTSTNDERDAHAALPQFRAAVDDFVAKAAGVVNIVLLSLKMKGGMAMRARRVRAGKAVA